MRLRAAESVPLQQKVFDLGCPFFGGCLMTRTTGLWLRTLQLRGGGIWRTWRFLIFGFLFNAAGDISFAYAGVFDLKALDPLFSFFFACTYAFLALGAHAQWELQTRPAREC